MNLSSEVRGDTLVIQVLDSRIDAAVALQFKEAVRNASEAPTNRIVLNMSDVQFVDSSGLGAIVGAMKQLGPGRAFELSSLNETVAKVFRLTRMDTIFKIHPTLENAFGV